MLTSIHYCRLMSFQQPRLVWSFLTTLEVNKTEFGPTSSSALITSQLFLLELTEETAPICICDMSLYLTSSLDLPLPNSHLTEIPPTTKRQYIVCNRMSKAVLFTWQKHCFEKMVLFISIISSEQEFISDKICTLISILSMTILNGTKVLTIPTFCNRIISIHKSWQRNRSLPLASSTRSMCPECTLAGFNDDFYIKVHTVQGSKVTQSGGLSLKWSWWMRCVI